MTSKEHPDYLLLGTTTYGIGYTTYGIGYTTYHHFPTWNPPSPNMTTWVVSVNDLYTVSDLFPNWVPVRNLYRGKKLVV